MPNLSTLRRRAESQFPDIVTSTAIVGNKLRIELIDGSYMDLWWSTQFIGRYAYHWERTHLDGTIYRHDNIPHLRWRTASTFPKHFHSGNRETVIESHISDDPEQGMTNFLQFARAALGTLGRDTSNKG